jgi:hypothetical protein
MIYPVTTLEITQQNFKSVIVADHFKIPPCCPLTRHVTATGESSRVHILPLSHH